MKNSKYILAGMSAFCLVLITATSIKSSFLMPLRTGVGFVLVPLQSGVNAIGTGLYNALENFSSLREAQEENKNLQMRLDQMVEENNRLQSELYELDRLRELYQLDQEYMQYKKIAARVIAKDSGNWFQVFRIDKGADDGIQEDMNVMAGDPAIMLLNILVSVIGSIIGLELIARLGISTNTSIIGALFAIIIARIPLKVFQKYKDINTQNLVQTAMSGATFAASNGIFLSIGIPYLLGRHDLVIPMLVGASLAVIIDATILYKVFDTEMFPAKEAWAPGIAAAEAMLAVAEKGKNSVILMIGMVGGIVGKIFGIPTDILGVGWIGNMWALGAFGVGLLISEYTPKFFNIKLGDYYVPHGVMIGAGFVALIQMILILQKKSKKEKEAAAGSKAVLSGV